MKTFHRLLASLLILPALAQAAPGGAAPGQTDPGRTDPGRTDPGRTETRAPKMILGWLETTELLDSGMRIKTKLDPGAKTSSMQATNIEQWERDGQPWVRFDFTDEDVDTDKEQTLRLEGPLVREVVIKRHGAPNVTRPVVAMEICLYHQIYRAEFSLTDRDKFNYAILLGRSFLAGVALVDSAETFLSRPDCKGHTAVRNLVP